MKKCKTECDLERCFLCSLCLKEWKPALQTHRINYQVKKGELIFEEGDEVKGVYFVYEGNEGP